LNTIRIVTQTARRVQKRIWDEIVMLVRDGCILVFGMLLGAIITAAMLRGPM
jgi:hypothetical protein